MPVLPPLTFEIADELRFILDLGVAVALALVGGMLAVRLRQPPIVGYLLAGVVIGPFTPGFVGDAGSINELAEIGVVLLLFALGVEFSLRELAPVRRVAVPGAILQVLVTAVAGALVGIPLGLSATGAVVVGAAVAISSTVVVLKVLQERGELDSLHGRTAVGWMVVQDLVTILLIALLEPFAEGGDLAGPVLLTLLRTALFLGLAYVVGTRLLPWLFRTVSRLGSPELFLLSVFATALLAAFLSSAVFGLSLALGAFVAGLIVSESELSHQAAGEITPFRDLFAVLFFVSVGNAPRPRRDGRRLARAPRPARGGDGRQVRQQPRLRTGAGDAAPERDPARRDHRPGRRVQLPARGAGALARAAGRAWLQPGAGHGGPAASS